MKYRQFISLPLLALFLAVAPTALASTIWYVNGVSGNDSENCSSAQTACKTIGHAISLASSGDSIVVAAATYTENLTIGISLTIVGSSASATIIDGGGVNTVVYVSNATAQVTLSSMTVRNGRAPFDGGGIFNLGRLTLLDSNVSGNSVGSGCTNPCSVIGGGIYNNGGTMAISNSTISGNSASAPIAFAFTYGGGIGNNRGTLTINNSTISGNIASHAHSFTQRGDDYGGGISNLLGTLKINNSTISGNRALAGRGKIDS